MLKRAVSSYRISSASVASLRKNCSLRTPSLFTSRDFGLIQKERNCSNNCKWRKASKMKPQGKILSSILAPEPSVLPIFNVRSSREPRRSRRVNSALALDPDNATLYERLGDVLTGLGRSAEASQAYQNARRLGRVNAGSTGSVQATARPEQVVPSKPSAEAVPSGSAAVAAPSGEAPLSSSTRESNTLSVQLQMLDKLRKDGLISGEEYKERKAKLLDTVFTAQPISIPAQPARMDDDRTVLADIKLGNFYALVIGNDDYKNIPKLKSAIVDAKAVGTLLEKEYGFRVTPLFNASRYQILSALSGFRPKLSERDSFLIYYAGHGVLDEDIQRGYWLPIDAEAKNSANWLSTTAIIDEVHGMKALHVLVVSDSCFSATLMRRGIVRGRQCE